MKEKIKTNNKRVTKIALKGRGNRYYAFRNLDRLRSLKAFKTLFNLLSVLAVIAFVVGVGAIGVWFILNVFTLFLLLSKFQNILNVGFYSFIAGAGVFILQLVLRILLEHIYFSAEKRELKKVPEGAEKYLDIMRVNMKVDFFNLVFWAVAAAAVIIGLQIDIQNKTVIGVIIVAILLALIASRIIFTRLYNKVAEQIDQVKAERSLSKEINAGT